MLQFVILTSLALAQQTAREQDVSIQKNIQLTVFAANGPAVLTAAFSPKGTQLAVGHVHGMITVYDVESKKPLSTLKGHSKNVTSVSFSPVGNLLASASSDKKLLVWDTLAKRERLSHTFDQRVTVAAFTPDGRSILAGTGYRGGLVQRIDLETNKATQVFDERTSHHAAYDAPDIRDLAIRSDGKVLAVGVFRGIVLVDLEGNQELRLLPEDESVAFRRCCYSNDGSWLASASRDITLWDPDTGRVRCRLKSRGSVAAIRFSPDNRYFVAGFDGGEDFSSEVAIWKTGQQEPIAVLDREAPSLKEVAFTPDGKQLMVCHAGGVKLWEFASILASSSGAD
jgi:WD40 repeat protein